MTQYSDYYATLREDGKIRAYSSSIPPKEINPQDEIPLSYFEYRVLASIPLSATRNGLDTSEIQEALDNINRKIKEVMEKNEN